MSSNRVLAIYAVHPISYQVPIFREMEKLAKKNNINLIILYGSNVSLKKVYYKEISTDFQPSGANLLDGYKFEFLDNKGTGNPGGLFSRVNFDFLINIIKKKYTKILIHGYDNITTIVAIIVCVIFDVPFIWRGENTPTTFNNKNFMNKIIKLVIGKLINQAENVAYSCIGNKKFLLMLGIKKKKFFFAPSCVDNNYYKKKIKINRKKPLNNYDPLICIFSGRYTERKRPMDLIQAVKNLSFKGINIQVLYAGGGPLEPLMKKFVTDNGLSIKFLGFLDQEMLAEAYLRAHVGVICSSHDPSPKVVNEMMACGLPIIASNLIGTAGDLVSDNETGLLYECGNIKELEGCLSSLVSNFHTIERMRSNVINNIDKWDCSVTASQLFYYLNKDD